MQLDPEQLEQLTAYLDGELDDEQSAAVERLLASDAAARGLLEELRRTSNLVASLPKARAPARLPEAVVARLERRALFETGGERGGALIRRVRWVRRLAAAACIMLAGTAGWLGYKGMTGETGRVAMNAPESAGNDRTVPSEARDKDVVIAGKSATDAEENLIAVAAAPPLDASRATTEADGRVALGRELREQPAAGGGGMGSESEGGVSGERLAMAGAEIRRIELRTAASAPAALYVESPEVVAPTSEMLAQLTFDDLPNQIVVETDARTQQEMAARFESLAADAPRDAGEDAESVAGKTVSVQRQAPPPHEGDIEFVVQAPAEQLRNCLVAMGYAATPDSTRPAILANGTPTADLKTAADLIVRASFEQRAGQTARFRAFAAPGRASMDALAETADAASRAERPAPPTTEPTYGIAARQDASGQAADADEKTRRNQTVGLADAVRKQPAEPPAGGRAARPSSEPKGEDPASSARRGVAETEEPTPRESSTQARILGLQPIDQQRLARQRIADLQSAGVVTLGIRLRAVDSRPTAGMAESAKPDFSETGPASAAPTTSQATTKPDAPSGDGVDP